MATVLAQLGGDFVWEWARPSGLWALFLPALLWVLSRLRAQPAAVATGTLALWKRVATSHPRRSSGSRQRTPPWAWCLIVALFLGALGLAGPRFVPPAPARTWTVVIDHSPSTSLVLSGGESRLGSALERARQFLFQHMASGDRAVWISSAHGPYQPHKPQGAALGPGELPPGRWLLHPAWFASAPRWELFDTPGTLWITDALPEYVPAHAALIASGGDAVPGAISASGTTSFEWDGERVTAVEGVHGRRALFLAGALPEPIAALARLWAEDRGLRVVVAPERERALELRLETTRSSAESVEVPMEVPMEVSVGRDGWSAQVSAANGCAALDHGRAPQEAWLRADDPDDAGADAVVLVRVSPGLVRIAFTDMTEPEGDPAAFAFSWSRLFDDWMLPVPGVVSFLERGAAGVATERAGDPPPTPPSVGTGAWLRGDDLDAWLAAASALLGAVALSLGRLTSR